MFGFTSAGYQLRVSNSPTAMNKEEMIRFIGFVVCEDNPKREDVIKAVHYSNLISKSSTIAKIRAWAREEMGVLDTPLFHTKNKETAIAYYDEALGQLLVRLDLIEKNIGGIEDEPK